MGREWEKMFFCILLLAFCHWWCWKRVATFRKKREKKILIYCLLNGEIKEDFLSDPLSSNKFHCKFMVLQIFLDPLWCFSRAIKQNAILSLTRFFFLILNSLAIYTLLSYHSGLMVVLLKAFSDIIFFSSIFLASQEYMTFYGVNGGRRLA